VAAAKNNSIGVGVAAWRGSLESDRYRKGSVGSNSETKKRGKAAAAETQRRISEKSTSRK